MHDPEKSKALESLIDPETQKISEQESPVSTTENLSESRTQVIASIKESIPETEAKIHEARSALGLPDQEEDPHSIEAATAHAARLEQEAGMNKKEVELPMDKIQAFGESIGKLSFIAKRQEDINATPLFDRSRLSGALSSFGELTSKKLVDPQEVAESINRISNALDTPAEPIRATRRNPEQDADDLKRFMGALRDVHDAQLAIRGSALSNDPEKSDPIFKSLQQLSSVAEKKYDEAVRMRGKIQRFLDR